MQKSLGFVADKLQAMPEISVLKTAIGKLLLEKERKILVIVDDIDRLSTREIEDLFRTIKAVANLPNVIYLLAFDTNVVMNALQGHYAQVGSDYIEKIVQVPFVLPNPDKVALRRLLFGRLDRILGGTPEGLFDPNYWANVYFDGIDHYINTPRDVNRLINVLRVDYPALVGEVNPVDFIAIESIKVFSPKFYEIIRANADSLCGVHLWGTSSKEKADEKAAYDRWIEREPDIDRAGLSKLARRLFPRFGEAYGGSSYAPNSLSVWTKQMPRLQSRPFSRLLPVLTLSRFCFRRRNALTAGEDIKHRGLHCSSHCVFKRTAARRQYPAPRYSPKIRSVYAGRACR